MKNTIKVLLGSFFITSFISCSENVETTNANESNVDLAKKILLLKISENR